MDVNDEYGLFNVPSISLNDIALYTVHPSVEIRRLRPFHPSGRRLTLDEWTNALFFVLNRFQNGLLLIEDINKFIGDHLPHDLVGAIATNRHAGLDIILSYQSLGRINTKIWGNMNLMRFHKNTESVDRHKIKFPDKFELLRIAEIMVDNEYLRGNIRFFLYVDVDEMKVRGDFSDALIKEAIGLYISEEDKKVLKPYLNQREGGKKKYTYETASEELHKRLKTMYF